MSVGAAALEAEVRQHRALIPSALSWGGFVSHLRWRHMVSGSRHLLSPRIQHCHHPCHKSQVLAEIYGRLIFTLVQAIARAILGRCLPNTDYIECVDVNNVMCMEINNSYRIQHFLCEKNYYCNL